MHESWEEKAKYQISENPEYGTLENVYLWGANDFQIRVIEMLKENHLACIKDNPITEFDKERMKAISEVYEDLINIVENLKATDDDARERAREYDSR
jgi:hypothetical protein